MNPLLARSPYEADRGELIGRDPRDLTPDDFAAAGVPLMPSPKAIRARCIDCCGGDVGEVRKCVATACPLWPLRMGNFPAALRAAAQIQPNRAAGKNPALGPVFDQDGGDQ